MVAYPVTTLPNTGHSVFYAYSIVAGHSGEPVGSFEKFGSSFTRTHERIREVLFSRGPITKEILWGGTDIQVTLARVELYKLPLIQTFNLGDPNLYTIESFNQVVDIVEQMRIPAIPGSPDQGAAAPQGTRYIVYKDCVPTNFTKDVDVSTAKVVENMTLECRTVEGYII